MREGKEGEGKRGEGREERRARGEGILRDNIDNTLFEVGGIVQVGGHEDRSSCALRYPL
jgi:hypothetical protein